MCAIEQTVLSHKFQATDKAPNDGTDFQNTAKRAAVPYLWKPAGRRGSGENQGQLLLSRVEKSRREGCTARASTYKINA